MRRGVWLLILGVLAAACTAAAARADGTTGTTTTTSAPTYARLTPSFLPTGCVGAGEAAIAEPSRKVLALGTPASAVGPSGYPAAVPVVAFGSATATGTTCRSAGVTLESVSLFGGFVTATSVAAVHGRGTVSGLEVGGSPAALAAGGSTLLGLWGQLTLGSTVGRVTAPLVVVLLKRHYLLPAGTTIFVGFAASPQPAARPKKTHPPATTTQRTTTTPAAASRQRASHTAHRAKKRHHKKPLPQPLKAKPSLGYRPKHYVFPVAGGASYGDSYGGERSDIYDGWHHGDDLFSPLGTPVVAVAKGKLSLVGWERLGGWRLWLTDNKGNSFYYAHLAGYSRWILHHRHVRKGEVIGFLGRTGDAFTTDPHLHFEVHPHQYDARGYDGAVDPTTYLEKWHVVHVPADEIPRPARLKAPRGAPRQEAAVVWDELLAARRRLLAAAAARSPARHGGSVGRPPILDAADEWPPQVVAVLPTAAHLPARASMTPWVGGGVSGAVLVVALSAGAFVFSRRRRTADEAET